MTIDNTYLTLAGWVPLRFEYRDLAEVGFFLYNPHTRTIVNKKEIMYNEVVSKEAFRSTWLSVVSYDDIPDHIREQAINLAYDKQNN